MIGPVLQQELLLGGRRGRQAVFRRIYTGWLVLLFLFFYWLYLINSNYIGYHLVNGAELDPSAAGSFAANLLQWLLIHQLFLVLFATPALVAGAITDEKAGGTLQYLLTADLT